jgi:hypothetical protein
MSKKNICSIPLDWTIEDYNLHSCRDGSHHHISHSQVHYYEQTDLVLWLRKSDSRRENSVVKVQLLPAMNAGQVTRSLCAPRTMNTGLSFRVGGYLAKRVRQRESWALVMLSHISGRPERESAV